MDTIALPGYARKYLFLIIIGRIIFPNPFCEKVLPESLLFLRVRRIKVPLKTLSKTSVLDFITLFSENAHLTWIRQSQVYSEGMIKIWPNKLLMIIPIYH